MFENLGMANALAAITIIGTLVVKFQEWPRWKRLLVIASACGCAGWAVQFYRDNAQHIPSSVAAFYMACIWLFLTAVMGASLVMADLMGPPVRQARPQCRQQHRERQRKDHLAASRI